jgi:hypothetical protein
LSAPIQQSALAYGPILLRDKRELAQFGGVPIMVDLSWLTESSSARHMPQDPKTLKPKALHNKMPEEPQP